jgi:thymidylate synthase
MQQYVDAIKTTLTNGKFTGDRTGVGTHSLFGHQYRVNLQDGFPLLTCRKISFDVALKDLLWMLSGSTNVNDLNEVGVKIWDEWATEDGSLGPIYGKLWRQYPHGKSMRINIASDGSSDIECGVIDQISDLIRNIKTHPNSRALVITAWNPATVPNPSLSPQENVKLGKQALASCNAFLQFKVYDGVISLQLYQRSADLVLGVPTNLAQYALLLHMVAHQCDLEVGEFIHTFGDIHIYSNHMEFVDELLTREPKSLPTLVIKRRPESIFDYTVDDFEIIGYDPHPAMKKPPVAV